MQIKAVGANGTKFDAKKINDNYLKKQGYDAHAIKREFLGNSANIDLFDLYQNKMGIFISFQNVVSVMEFPQVII